MQHTYHGLKIADFINSFLQWKNSYDDKSSRCLNQTGVAYSTQMQGEIVFVMLQFS